MLYALTGSKTCGYCSQSHNAVIIKRNNNKMTTKMTRCFMYERYAKITYVKIRTFVSEIKYVLYVRIEL